MDLFKFQRPKKTNKGIIKYICAGILIGTIISFLVLAQVTNSKNTDLGKKTETVKKSLTAKTKSGKIKSPNVKSSRNSIKKKANSRMRQSNKQTGIKIRSDKKKGKVCSGSVKNVRKKNVKSDPKISNAESAGTFTGDLRDVPKTKPVRQQRPQKEAPKIIPKAIVRDPKIDPDN